VFNVVYNVVVDVEDERAETVYMVGCVVQWYDVGLRPACFRCPALGLQLTGDHYVGKPSATGQPTRPTQPFILSRSIN